MRGHGVWLSILGLLVLGSVCPTRATKPMAAPRVPMPDSFVLTYSVTPGGPGPATGDRTNRLEVSFSSGRAGKLTLTLSERGKVRSVVIDPWPLESVRALWEKVEQADLFRFKPQPGPMAPDFGSVTLACQASFGRLAHKADLSWTSPLRNDGQVWPLIDHLDRLMSGPGASPSPPGQPGQTGAAPVGPSGADRVGEIEMLIALEATHLPIASDDMSMALAGSINSGPLFERQKPKIRKAIGILNDRIAGNPKDVEPYSLRGAFQYDLAEYDKAVESFGEAVRQQPHQADHYNNRGMAYYRLGRNKEALADFGEALERNRSKYAHLERLIARIRSK